MLATFKNNFSIDNSNHSNQQQKQTLRNEKDLILNTNSSLSELNSGNEILKHVNKNIVQNPMHSRLFAVVQIAGSQYKITTEDIVLVRNPFYPTIGDRIRLEKVLLIGGKDFTVLGKPLVSKEFVRIEATVIEKTLSQNVIVFRYKPRKDNRRMDCKFFYNYECFFIQSK